MPHARTHARTHARMHARAQFARKHERRVHARAPCARTHAVCSHARIPCACTHPSALTHARRVHYKHARTPWARTHTVSTRTPCARTHARFLKEAPAAIAVRPLADDGSFKVAGSRAQNSGFTRGAQRSLTEIESKGSFAGELQRLICWKHCALICTTVLLPWPVSTTV
jgi:hypothetical protein